MFLPNTWMAVMGQHRFRKERMGVLVQFKEADGGAFKALWEGFWAVSAPKTPREIRTALAIQEKLESVSIEDETPPNRVLLAPMLARTAELFFEDEPFQYLKQTLADVRVPQPRVRDFARLWDILEDAEKNWKGDELKLRSQLMEPAETP